MAHSKETILAVQKMQDFIEKNLNEAITLSNLAKVAGYSQSHCSRVFKELTGKLPFEYIRTLRLTEAARLLRDNNVKVLDVALDFMFDTHEGFTRAFTKEFGVSPYRYKQNPSPLRYFIPYSVLIQNLTKVYGEKKMEKRKVIFTQVIERPIRKAIIKRAVKATHYFEYCGEVNCEIWGVLESIKEANYEPAGFWLPDKLIKSGTSKYVQGVEVPLDYSGQVPDGFELIELEPCKFMVFQGEPYDDKDFEEEVGAIMELIDEFNPNIYGYEWVDGDAPRFQLAPFGYRGYIEARPVKSK